MGGRPQPDTLRALAQLDDTGEHLPPVSDDEFRQAMQRHREDYCTFAIQAFASITLWVGALVTVLWQLVH